MPLFTPGISDAVVGGVIVLSVERLIDFVFGRRLYNGLSKPGFYSMFRYGIFLVVELLWVIYIGYQAYLEHGHRGFNNGFLFGAALFTIPFWLVAIRNNLGSLRSGVTLFQHFNQRAKLNDELRTSMKKYEKLAVIVEQQLNHILMQLATLNDQLEEEQGLLRRLEEIGVADKDYRAEETRIEAERAGLTAEKKKAEKDLSDLKLQQLETLLGHLQREKEEEHDIQTQIDAERQKRKGFLGW